ncbi:MAG: DEAD/DEAH box helicase [Patescibacteria group bacterium]|nr:DEAD/DEAH box helicase [Patescibacteria group bacterium]
MARIRRTRLDRARRNPRRDDTGGASVTAIADPYRWQQIEDDLHGDKPKRGIFASPRLGKTFAITRSLVRRRPKRALITAPLKVCPLWCDVLTQAGLPVEPIYDFSAAKIANTFRKPWDGVLVVNRDKLLACANVLDDLDAFVADESHAFSGISTDRATAYRKLARTTPWVRALTGTPVARHYGSLWSQLCAFGGGWEAFPNYEWFAQRFLVRDAMFRSRVLAHINVDELQRLVLAVASVYRREDYFGPDSWQVISRDVEMPESAWRLYHELAKRWILTLPSGTELAAQNPAVRLVRLQEITSGFLPDSPGIAAPLHQAKVDMLLADFEEIERSGEKLVVWHRFTHEGETAFLEFSRLYPMVPIYRINGGVEANCAQDAAQAFNDDNGSAVCIAQIQSASEGISLRGADHAAYLSRTFSFVDDEQSRDRIYAIGKPRTITYYNVPGTVDDFVIELLAAKRDLHEAVRNVDREALVYGTLRRKRRTA